MDNPEKLATQGAQEEDKQNKNTTQNDTVVCWLTWKMLKDTKKVNGIRKSKDRQYNGQEKNMTKGETKN